MSTGIHPLSDVQSKNIGEGTTIWQFVVVLKGATIGVNCNINCHCFLENDVKMGNNVTVKAGVYLWDGIEIEDDVFIGPNASFTNDTMPRSKRYPDKFEKIVIRQGASVGAGVTVIAPIEIGKYALIGAGSVVTRNIPPYTIWYGNPARQKGYITKDGKILDMELRDSEGKQYSYKNLDI